MGPFLVNLMKDKVLILRCKQGDTEALRSIYEKYRDDLLLLAVALLNDINVAEDALHDVFLSFAQQIDNFKLTGSLKGYLATCVANRSRNMLRDRKTTMTTPEEANSLASDTNEPSASIICNEQLQLLSGALAQLPDEQKETILLHMYGSMRFKEIAGTQQVSVNTVKSRYRYGIEKLRVILNGQVKL